MPPAKLGLVYGHTGLRKFIDTVGLPRTKELFFTGRNIDAARAEQIGLVHEVVADDALEPDSVELAAAIAANAPLSMRGNKSAIETLAHNPVLSDAQEAGPDRPARVLLRLARTSARGSRPSPRNASRSGGDDERRGRPRPRSWPPPTR